MKNAERFERLWEEEKDKSRQLNANRDPKSEPIKPSLSKVAWTFGKTRFIISLTLVVLSMFFQFAGPVEEFSYSW